MDFWFCCHVVQAIAYTALCAKDRTRINRFAHVILAASMWALVVSYVIAHESQAMTA
jgi:hypothetical protein